MTIQNQPTPRCDLCDGSDEGKELVQCANGVAVCHRCHALKTSQVNWLVAVRGANLRKDVLYYCSNVSAEPLPLCIACGEMIKGAAWCSTTGYYHDIPEACKEYS